MIKDILQKDYVDHVISINIIKLKVEKDGIWNGIHSGMRGLAKITKHYNDKKPKKSKDKVYYKFKR